MPEFPGEGDMKFYNKLIGAFLFLSLLTIGATAQKSKKKPVSKTKPIAAKPKPPVTPPANMNYQILLQGSQSKVETPFVFVARDSETYALMRSLVEGLPASSTIDFSKNVVVAAFAGTRNSGGWSVAITKSGAQTAINLNAPPKGAMTAQVITTPFQTALVPLESSANVSLALNPHWTRAIINYRLAKGDFEFSGGIAGRLVKFKAEGSIGILSDGTHQTYFFDLKGKNADGNRKFTDVASGVVNAGQIQIVRAEPGSFADQPHPPVKITGTANGEKLVLNFESLPPTVADGFMAGGKLEAVRVK